MRITHIGIPLCVQQDLWHEGGWHPRALRAFKVQPGVLQALLFRHIFLLQPAVSAAINITFYAR